jgi:acyl-CoA synthetase (AMP-forming)/AMP-acid ligase II
MNMPRPCLGIIDYFDKGVALDPKRLFLVDETGSCSYGETQLFSHRIANAFLRDGVEPGTRVAVYSANATRAFECVIGLIRSACVWVPVSIRNTVEDTVYALNNTGTRVLFYSAAFSEEVEKILAESPAITHTICIDSKTTPHVYVDDMIAGLPDISAEVPVQPDEVITLFSSGGTTGKPKGVMMPHLAWEAMIAGAQRLNWHPHPIHLVAAPMTHAAGGSALMMTPMGATNIMLPGFDPVRVMSAIQEYRVTHLFLPPTAIYRLLAHPEVRNYDYSSLCFFNFASAPMAPEKIKEAVAIFGPVMMTGFGSTELGVNISFFSPPEVAAAAQDNARRLESCGKATLFARVEIMDEAGNMVPAETPGEIVVRSNQVMKGYFKNEEETRRALAGGWYHTADIGIKDTDGYIYLIDRKRDIIISGGFNIFPSEVEKVIVSHPSVQDCAVVGVPDENWGEAVKAVIEAKTDHCIDIQEMVKFCKDKLSAFKVPKSFDIVDVLPRSAAGKVLRREVRAPYWIGRTRQI